ncbi:MAG: acyl-CoA/acyl-ACP dehydrogenase [Desulfobacteraceae bacterium]|nr:acyl-CoA/acyl-ACP dehydrogenase [Desulfobacteraceae bacterium]
MEYLLTADQIKLKEKTASFVEKEIPPEVAIEVDRADLFPHELMEKLGSEGFWKINIPKEYGGDQGNVIDLMVFFEEISKALPVLAWTAGDVLLYGNNIIKVNGSKEQKDLFLPRLAKGELKFCFALSEPDAGSDAANIRTAAAKAGEGYIINGSKVFISGASVADIAVTNTRTGEDRYRGVTSFLVDTQSPGYEATPIKKIGYKGSDTCEVFYKDVAVGSGDILGGEAYLNRGWEQIMRLLNNERLVLSACALGISDTILNEVIRTVRDKVKNAPVPGQYQDLEHEVAEMAVHLESARSLAYRAAWLESQGRECIKETSMTKYWCAEIGKKIAWRGVRILGEQAQNVYSNTQRLFRDIPVLAIGGGTSQVQKNIISKILGF